MKPKSRHNVPRKRREVAISGKKKPLRCQFCRQHPNIQSCAVISKIGVCLVDKDIIKYCTLFNRLNANQGKIDFKDWKVEGSVLVDGITKQAQHFLLHGLFKYQSIGCPDNIVVGVQFLADGGIALAEYDLVPKTLDAIV